MDNIIALSEKSTMTDCRLPKDQCSIFFVVDYPAHEDKVPKLEETKKLISLECFKFGVASTIMLESHMIMFVFQELSVDAGILPTLFRKLFM